jgi:predicted HTH transcriptional regulator
MKRDNKKKGKDHSNIIRKLDPKQGKALELFKKHDFITAKQIGNIFGFQSRTNSALCKKWIEDGFLEIVDHSNKSRKYKLAKPFYIVLK